MKAIKTSKGTFIFSELLIYYDYSSVEGKVDSTGTYTFLCTTDTITEYIAKEIVDYKHTNIESWVECFHLFMANNGINTTSKNYAICKKVN